MNANNLSWDDMRVVLAIVRNKSLAGAARSLGSSHATIFRRLNAIERRLALRLFFRSRKGYTPTPEGEDLGATAARIELELLGVERRLAGQVQELSGAIRLTTTDSLLAGPLGPSLQKFAQDYPYINLEITLSNRLYDLGTRDADIAVRPGAQPDDSLIGRKIGSITQSVYIAKHALSSKRWIGPDKQLCYIALEKWMDSGGLDAACSCRIDSVLGMYHAVQAGMGKALLPDYLAAGDKTLVRLGEPVSQLETDLWILTHPEVMRAERVKVLRTHLIDDVAQRFYPTPTGEF